MRRPSTTAEIYRWHLAALRGERPAVIEGEPQAGWYWRRFVEGGPRVPVLIRLIQPRDLDTGALDGDERLLMWTGGDQWCEREERQCAIERAWTHIARHPITEDEYEALCATCPAACMAPVAHSEPPRP